MTADFLLAGVQPGANLAAKFQPRTQGVWELVLEQPLTELKTGTLTVTVRDRQGNTARIDRTFAVGR